jgi:small conductance mechanosensitive channel
VDLVAQISGGADPKEVIAKLAARVSGIPNVVKEPTPVIVILTFTLAGDMAIREVCGDGAFPAPMPYLVKTVG